MGGTSPGTQQDRAGVWVVQAVCGGALGAFSQAGRLGLRWVCLPFALGLCAVGWVGIWLVESCLWALRKAGSGGPGGERGHLSRGAEQCPCTAPPLNPAVLFPGLSQAGGHWP